MSELTVSKEVSFTHILNLEKCLTLILKHKILCPNFNCITVSIAKIYIKTKVSII